MGKKANGGFSDSTVACDMKVDFCNELDKLLKKSWL